MDTSGRGPQMREKRQAIRRRSMQKTLIFESRKDP